MRHLALISILLFARTSQANEHRLKLVVDPSQPISALSWDPSPETQQPILQKTITIQNKIIYFVTLKGKYLGKTSNFIYESKKVALGPQGAFAITVPIAGERQQFNVSEIDPQGTVRTEGLELIFPEWKAVTTGHQAVPKKRFSFSPGLGFTAISYQQSGWPILIEFALTGKLSFDYSLGEHWDIGANTYGTVLPMYSNPSGQNIHFFGGNLKTGYKVSLSSRKAWVLKILAGYYYTTTIASSFGIGYQNVQGPELYPSLNYYFSNGKAAWLYFKFSPILNDTTFLDPSNFEAAVGGGILFLPLKGGGGLGATLDVASLKLFFDNKSILSNSYTLGFNFRF